ncbi:MAG: hypothetical protein JO132_08335, partial [Streptosporangiaceae bacterium]|nr:hypothetical protein [Streptosporangiaceae bacterium]
LAVVADRVIAVVRRHVLGGHERSPWLAAAPLAAYGLRLVLAPPSTALGLRRWLLAKTPLPAGPPALQAHQRNVTGSSDAATGPRGGSKTARFLALVQQRHGPLHVFPPERVSRTATELAPEVGLDVGAARTALRHAVLAARDGRQDT